MTDTEPTIELSLKLQLPLKTVKKLKAFAMLSGMSIDELEANLLAEIQPELAKHFDQTLSEGIANKLSELDGTQVRILSEGEQAHLQEPEHSLSSDDDTEENLSIAEQVEKDQAMMATLPKPIAEASQKVASLLLKKKAAGKTTRSSPSPATPSDQEQLPFDIDVPEAEDAEDFLDSMNEAIKTGQVIQQEMGPFGIETSARSSFDPRSPRVKIKDAGWGK